MWEVPSEAVLDNDVVSGSHVVIGRYVVGCCFGHHGFGTDVSASGYVSVRV